MLYLRYAGGRGLATSLTVHFRSLTRTGVVDVREPTCEGTNICTCAAGPMRQGTNTNPTCSGTGAALPPQPGFPWIVILLSWFAHVTPVLLHSGYVPVPCIVFAAQVQTDVVAWNVGPLKHLTHHNCLAQ